jgi:hypothetical protein
MCSTRCPGSDSRWVHAYSKEKGATCPDCGGRMRMVAALTDPASVKTEKEGTEAYARTENCLISFPK